MLKNLNAEEIIFTIGFACFFEIAALTLAIVMPITMLITKRSDMRKASQYTTSLDRSVFNTAQNDRFVELSNAA